MSAKRKNILRWLMIFCGLCTLLSCIIYFLMHSSLPKYSGEISSNDLEKPVEVRMDEYGIPHIRAESFHDVYYALGYIVGQERLFQLEMHRRAARGTLSEVVGQKALFHDKRSRTLLLNRFFRPKLQENWEQLPRNIQIAVESYLKGLNEFIENGPTPFEFQMLSIPKKPFSIEDILSFIAYMSLGFNEGSRVDLLLAELESPSRDLYADYTSSAPTIADSESLGFESLAKLSPQKVFADFANPIVGEIRSWSDFSLPTLKGSNSWVLSGEKTTSGYPLLANDPHIGVSNPSLWFEAHLHVPSENWLLKGQFLSCIPFALIGRTKKHAWAFTMASYDNFDVYIEKRNPENKREISFRDHWVKTEMISEHIPIRGEKGVGLNIEIGPHGPLLDPIFQSKKEGFSYSAHWALHRDDNFPFESLYLFGHAKDMAEFRHGVSLGVAPGINVSYADTDSNIAWWVYGQIPRRKKDDSGKRLKKGWENLDQPLGYLRFDENPSLVNPESGIIITANQQLTRKTHIPGYFQDGNRTQRLFELFSQQKKWSSEDMRTIQLDEKTIRWKDHKTWLNLLEKKYKSTNEYALLENWNGISSLDSPGAAIYHYWLQELYKEFASEHFDEKQMIRYFRNGVAWHFWEKKLEKSEDLGPKLNKTFSRTIEGLRKRFGSNSKEWRWGDLHKIEYVHPLGRSRWLSKIFNLGPYPVGGGTSHVNAMASKNLKKPFYVTSSPSVRRVVQLSDPIQSWSMMPTGNSGHRLSPHFSDQVEPFFAGRLRKHRNDWNEIKTHIKRKLVFVPTHK